MLFTEWNLKDALEVRYEEGEARGREEGEAKARLELFTLLESGMSLAEAKQKFGY
jgi:flagellar biosynthesis/type III secretory pathway protein FliH